MNKYKIEFKQTFKKEVTVYADDEDAAMNIVEQTYLKLQLQKVHKAKILFGTLQQVCYY